jgi:NAD-dependent deacetylase
LAVVQSRGRNRAGAGNGVAYDEGAGELAALLRSAKSAVVFTGAGISTESGIADFRSPGGIWSRMAPIDFRDFMASADWRREAWRRRFAMEEMFSSVKPNEGHLAVADLVFRGIVGHVITQNIDNLHQDSGIAEDRIIELHGNTRYARCLNCGARSELEPIRKHFEATGEPSDCIFCAGLLKTATISFGQAMPEAEMARAETVTHACDLFLVLGSSLVVYPAAAFPMMAKRRGATLAIVNREQTPQDEAADLVIHAGIGPTLGRAVRMLAAE